MGKISDALDKYQSEKKEYFYRKSSLSDQPIRAEEREIVSSQDLVQDRGFSDKLLIFTSPHSITAEAFKIIRGSVLYDKNRTTPKAIMVTSAFPGEGKTFVASNLAISFAMGLNENVLLIDCDLRRPSMHEMFGIKNLYGLADYLQEKKGIPEILIKTNIKKLTLLLAGIQPSNPVELLSSKKMEDFIHEAKNRYHDRFIILDAAPSQLTAETNTVANHVDGIIFVVMNGRTPRAAILQTIENIGREKILGIVFNGSSMSYKEYNKYYKKYYQ
ncbi:MAG: hypothetical protein AVO38_15580 [delta proteobacterium ML8_D]|jgi:protein-tyrosine kinase|nr:MAG: hypothetical protein AVO38_15580 [delta proteobacterium ML8_D]